jgi:Sigma-70, region 4
MCCSCFPLYLLGCSWVLWQVKCTHEGCTRLVPHHGHGYHHLCNEHKSDAKPAPAIEPVESSKHECYLYNFLSPACIDPIHTHLSSLQRNAIVAFHAIGMSNKAIAQKMMVDERTVKKWIERAHENISLRDEPRAGRPPKLKEEEKKKIFDASKQHPRRATPPMLHHELQLSKSCH